MLSGKNKTRAKSPANNTQAKSSANNTQKQTQSRSSSPEKPLQPNNTQKDKNIDVSSAEEPDIVFDEVGDVEELFDAELNKHQDIAPLKNHVEPITMADTKHTTPLIDNNKKYLFITLHKLEENTITSTIINVFESNNDFILKTTYETKYSNKYFSIKNLIGVKDENAFVSKVKPYNRDNWNFEIGADISYSQVCNKIYEPDSGKECIMFYVHTGTGTGTNVTDAYYTKGGIFVFRSKGIGSTQEICKCTNDKDNLDFIKELIVKQEFRGIIKLKQPSPPIKQPSPPIKQPSPSIKQPYTKQPVKQYNYDNPEYRNQFSKAQVEFITQDKAKRFLQKNGNYIVKPELKIPLTFSVNDGPDNNNEVTILSNPRIITSNHEQIKGKANIKDLQIIPTSQKGGANIEVSKQTRYRFNNIMPSFFANITGTTEIPTQISTLIKMYYADFTIPPGSNNETIELFTQLYMLYDEYQTQINFEYNKGSELKKELFVFDSDKKRISDNLKINKFIYYLNQNLKNNNEQYNNISFPIHYIDLQDFIVFLNSGYGTRTDIITMCTNALKTIDKITIDDALKPSLEGIITNNNKNAKKIYSYLKILNFEAPTQYSGSVSVSSSNERYKIDVSNNIVKLGHIRDKSAFYSATNPITENNNNLNKHAEINNDKQKEPRNLIYDDNLTLGPFENVFGENAGINSITESMNELVYKVVEGKKVFIMGYGVTGSGKTSTLIHYNNQPGVIMQMCNMVGSKMLTETTTNNVYATVSYVEYFKVINPEKVVDLSNNLNTYFELKGSDNNFKSVGSIDFTTDHSYRSGISKSFNAKTSMGEVLKFIIDDDRLVKATPNNPNSSRSHVICIIRFFDDERQVKDSINNYPRFLYNLKNGKYSNTNFPRCLIVGDLAGVENKFTCNNYYTLKNFFNVKKEGSTEPFYKNNFYEGKFDPIYNVPTPITPTQNGGETEPEKYVKYFDENYFVFNQDTVKTLFDNIGIDKERYKYYLKYIFGLIGISNETINSDMVTKGDYIFKQLEGLEKIMQAEKDKLSQLIKTENEANNNNNNNDIYKYQWTLDKDGLWYKLIQVLIGFGKANALSTNLPGEYLKAHGLNANDEPNPETNKLINDADTTNREKYAEYKTQAIKLLDYNNVVKMVETMKKCIKINNYMKKICENRVSEGQYINQSLKDLTSDIHKILLYENQNSYYMPQYTNECFDQYYPFNVPELNDPDVRFSSDIMKYIYKNTFANELSVTKPEATGIQSEATVTSEATGIQSEIELIPPNFFSNIEICIFGVFNSSRRLNNPPPIQYININTLKRHLYHNEYDKFKIELSKLIIEQDTKYENDKSINKSVRYSIKTVSPYSWNVLKAVSDFVQNRLTLTFDVFNHIVKLLTLIENRNRLTQIGTVEFLDKIAKLNSIQASCEVIPETGSNKKPAVPTLGK